MKQQNDHKSGFVAIIGRPNVGKSTLINSLTGQKAAITANKPQTTRNRILAITTHPDCQIIFVDTPGIHPAKNRLGELMVDVACQSLRDADVALWLVEPTETIGSGEEYIRGQLDGAGIPAILVINKIDMIPKEGLFAIIDAYRRRWEFSAIVPVSARERDNLDTLCRCIREILPLGPPLFPDGETTDQSRETQTAEIIREKALHVLRDEIPHGIAVVIDLLKRRGKICDITATIICERDSHKGIIIGKNGQMLKAIGTNARYELEQMYQSRVNLQLFVKVKKDWRENEQLIKEYVIRSRQY